MKPRAAWGSSGGLCRPLAISASSTHWCAAYCWRNAPEATRPRQESRRRGPPAHRLRSQVAHRLGGQRAYAVSFSESAGWWCGSVRGVAGDVGGGAGRGRGGGSSAPTDAPGRVFRRLVNTGPSGPCRGGVGRTFSFPRISNSASMFSQNSPTSLPFCLAPEPPPRRFPICSQAPHPCSSPFLWPPPSRAPLLPSYSCLFRTRTRSLFGACMMAFLRKCFSMHTASLLPGPCRPSALPPEHPHQAQVLSAPIISLVNRGILLCSGFWQASLRDLEIVVAKMFLPSAKS